MGKLLLASSFFEFVVASCSRREFAKDRKSLIRCLLMSFEFWNNNFKYLSIPASSWLSFLSIRIKGFQNFTHYFILSIINTSQFSLNLLNNVRRVVQALQCFYTLIDICFLIATHFFTTFLCLLPDNFFVKWLTVVVVSSTRRDMSTITREYFRLFCWWFMSLVTNITGQVIPWTPNGSSIVQTLRRS